MSELVIGPGVTQATHGRLRGREDADAHPQYSLTAHGHDEDYSASGHAHDYVSSSAAGVVVHGGSTVGTTSPGGDLTIDYPDMSTVTAFVPANGDGGIGGYYVAVITKGTTSGVVRCFDSAGAPFASALVRIDWIVMGT